jgi:hypothetical protein
MAVLAVGVAQGCVGGMRRILRLRRRTSLIL